MRIIKTLIVLVVLVVIAGVAWHFYLQRAKGDGPDYRTATVTQGTLVSTIGATGTIEPEEQVDVGAQVAGKIIQFGMDTAGHPVDYNSVVKEGQVLAKIDPTLYESDVKTAQAQLAQAQASVAVARANLLQNQAQLENALQNWKRAQQLGPSEALAQTNYDAYKAAYDAAKANVAAAEATITEDQANVSAAQANVDKAMQNLNYCVIESPVNGTIIDRRVDIGQTVVSSLSAPSLFLIARDLHRMEVWVAVNEADVGNIHPGQAVTFTVDAFPGETFRGTVKSVRLNATMTQNVVIYTVVVGTDNSSGRLLPYLTANVQFELARHENILQAPNAALRWTPDLKEIAPQYRQGLPLGQQPSSAPATPSARAYKGMGHGMLWVKDGQYLKPVPVRTGITDGVMTEVAGRDVTDGMIVVTGEKVTSADDGVTNPFAPQFGKVFQRNRQQNQQHAQGQAPAAGGQEQPQKPAAGGPGQPPASGGQGRGPRQGGRGQ